MALLVFQSVASIGTVVERTDFVVEGTGGNALVETTIDQLKESWQGTSKWSFSVVMKVKCEA